MYVSSVVVVGLYFDRRRALAVGVASSGSGIGIFVIAAATGALLKVMSWRSISQIEAALMVLGIISGLTLRPLPKDVSEIEENAEKSKWKIFIDRLDIKLFKILAFDLICCVFILGTTGCMLPYMYLPDVAQQYGIDTKDAAFLLSITGITNTIARVSTTRVLNGVYLSIVVFSLINPIELLFASRRILLSNCLTADFTLSLSLRVTFFASYGSPCICLSVCLSVSLSLLLCA
ncbi:unnamed protein product [Acanthosepion pharaonis]|uniref:Major facilitator superfamily (MFS) profile domain-containing protein n=1 Tax=Acanthosepion pharaonis TaxID=158019 RepID=A0A812CAU1_ACAPH|nr:unnamed protein product [Sepia pharaonis]